MEEVKNKKVILVFNKCSGRLNKNKFFFIYKIIDFLNLLCFMEVWVGSICRF